MHRGCNTLIDYDPAQCWLRLRFWRLRRDRSNSHRAAAAARDYYCCYYDYYLLQLLSNVIKLCIHLLSELCAVSAPHPPLTSSILAGAIKIPNLLLIEMCIAATSDRRIEGVCQHLTGSIEFIAISVIASRMDRREKEKQLSEAFHNQFNGSKITSYTSKCDIYVR